jgi:hypothetical protein
MSNERKFNVLASLNKNMGKVEKGEKIVPKQVNLDPNRLTWPYLKLKDLKKDVSYTMRVLPAHPTKNPNGYVRKEMYQIPYELDHEKKNGWAQHDCKIVTVPGCVDPNLPDPIYDICIKINNLMNGPTAFEFVIDSEDEEGNVEGHYDLIEGFEEPTLSDLFRDELENGKNSEDLVTFIKVLGSPWVQNILPVIIWAEADSVKNGQYTNYTNYRPAEMEDEFILTRRFQMTDVKPFRDSKTGFVVKLKDKNSLPESTPEEKMAKRSHMQWNHDKKGLSFNFMHTSGVGTAKGYAFEPVLDSVGELPEVISEKLEVSDDNYPDLVQTELRGGLKSPDEMLNLFMGSPYAELLRPFGIYD